MCEKPSNSLSSTSMLRDSGCWRRPGKRRDAKAVGMNRGLSSCWLKKPRASWAMNLPGGRRGVRQRDTRRRQRRHVAAQRTRSGTRAKMTRRSSSVSGVPSSSARRRRLEGSRRRAESPPLPPRGHAAAAAAAEEGDAIDETRGRPRRPPADRSFYIKPSSLNSNRRNLHSDRRPADSNWRNLDSNPRQP